MQNSVTDRSLSIVLGTPTVGKPASWSFAAKLSVSSPPIGTSASTPWCRRVLVTRTIPSCSLAGLVRDVPRMVPPVGRMPRTSAGVSSSISPSSMQPAQPFLTPLTWCPSWNARRATARIAAFKPGASPPPVRIPIRTRNRLRRLESLQELAQGDVGQRSQGQVGVRQVEAGGDRVWNRDGAHAGAFCRPYPVRRVFARDRLAPLDTPAL